MTKIAGSGSNSQRRGSTDPDPDPDPHQNVMDPQHWLKETQAPCTFVGYLAAPLLSLQLTQAHLYLTNREQRD
jgi:hypothetical protein